jgi:predicted nucleic acid-binding protein
LILADTSIWVDHLRAGDPNLVRLLERAAILCHPFVIGELALGGLGRDSPVMDLLNSIPHAPVTSHAETLQFAYANRLAGSGIGWVDAHLLASTRLGAAAIWTRDKRLGTAAARMGISANLP